MKKDKQESDDLYIFGAGRAIGELEEVEDLYDRYDRVILVEDNPSSKMKHKKEVISYREALSLKDDIENGFISCGDVSFKERVDCDFSWVHWDNFISDKADAYIDYAWGLWVGAFAHLSGKASVGRHVRLNYGAKVCHHTRVGDYSFISINAVLLSGASVGNKSFIGAGAVLLPDVAVGDNCVIGANAVVTKDIPDNTKAMGVPARW